jgi:electron transfer flavoprotein beta subunit
MRLLVCVKRVPAPGAKITLTPDGSEVDTTHLGFTVSPHEECAVEEAVRLVAAHGGSSTVLTLGPLAAEDQLRNAIAMGIDHGTLLPMEGPEWDARAVAGAIVDAVRVLEEDDGRFDLMLFGNESADAGNHQVAVRVAHALGRPVVDGVKGIEVTDGEVALRRAVAEGHTVHHLPLPAVAAVKEGLNLPRYPAMRGRLMAKKATIRHVEPRHREGGLRRLRLRAPEQQRTETTVLGTGAAAAPAVADILEEVGLL